VLRGPVARRPWLSPALRSFRSRWRSVPGVACVPWRGTAVDSCAHSRRFSSLPAAGRSVRQSAPSAGPLRRVVPFRGPP